MTENSPLSKSVKIKIALSVIWSALTALMAGSAASNYDHFKFDAFLGVMLVCNFLPLLYWLGFWIWGDGYVSGFFKRLFAPLTADNSKIAKFLLLDDPLKKHPWRRFFARQTDFILCGYLIAAFVDFIVFRVGVILPDFFSEKWCGWMLILLITGFIESLCLAKFSVTPGKWMLGLKVMKADGQKLSFDEALTRYGRVVWKGLAVGFPIVSLYTVLKSRNQLVFEGKTSWDKELNLQVDTKKIPLIGLLLCLAVLISFPIDVYEQNRIGYEVEQLGRSAPEYANKRAETLKGYLTQAQAIFAGKLEPKSLQNSNDLYAFAVAIQTCRELINTTQRDIQKTYDDVEAQVRGLNVSSSYKEKLIGLYKQRNESDQKFVALLLANERAVLTQFEALYNLLASNVNSYSVQDNQFVFSSQQAVDSYNQIQKDLSVISEKRKEIMGQNK